YAFGPAKREHVVELTPRFVYPRHSGGERLAGHGPYVRRILRPEVIDEQRIEARLAVPLQPVQEFPDGVVTVPYGGEHHGVRALTPVVHAVPVLDVVPEPRIIRVRPPARFLRWFPRHRVHHVYEVLELVQCYLPRQVLVEREYEPQVGYGLLYLARL